MKKFVHLFLFILNGSNNINIKNNYNKNKNSNLLLSKCLCALKYVYICNLFIHLVSHFGTDLLDNWRHLSFVQDTYINLINVSYIVWLNL